MTAQIIGVIAPTIYEASDVLVEHGLDCSKVQVRFMSYQQPKRAPEWFFGFTTLERIERPEVPHAD